MSRRALALALAALALALALVASGGAAVGHRVTLNAGGAVRIDGRPTFLIAAGWLSPESVPRALALGVNTFISRRPGRRELDLVRAVGQRGFVVPELSATGPHDGPPLFYDGIGYTLQDEPDDDGISAADLPNPLDLRSTGKAVWLTLSPGFVRASALAPEYAAYVARAQVVLTDPYPEAHGCADGDVRSLSVVYDAVLRLAALARSPKALGEWIETGPIEGYCGPDPVSPRVTSAEAWAAVAAGAKVIAWFTHSWTKGHEDELDLGPGMAAAVQATDAELDRFAPVLLAPRLAGVVSSLDDPIKVGAFAVGGNAYLLAVNLSDAPVQLADDPVAGAWMRQLPGLGSQDVTDLTRGRELTATGGSFDDAFAPFQHRLYRWTPQAGPAA